MRISDWSSDVCSSDLVVLRGDDQAARILVDAVDDAGPRDAADARKLSRAMVEQRVDERAVEIARGGVDDHAGGLVDDDQMLILPGDDQIQVLRGVMRRGGDGEATCRLARYAVTAERRSCGLAPVSAVKEHGTA